MKLFNVPQNKNFRRHLRNEATVHERKLWSRLRNDQLGHRFRRQFGIGIYIVDFYCPAKRLVVELDGSQHFENASLAYDTERSEFLRSVGCEVLRFTDGEINTNIEGVLLKISDVLQTSPLSPP